MSQDDVLDLTRVAEESSDRDVYKTLVAVFKEGPDTPRVLTDSDSYLAYTLKNGRTLRLICRGNNMKGTFKAHKNPIHAVKFVNHCSNVAASSSQNEFHLWVVKDENPPDADPATAMLTVRICFSLSQDPPTTIANFAFFINAAASTPDVLILYGKKAAVLESSKIISNYSNEPLLASLSSNSLPLRDLAQSVTTETLCSINNAGWFAFTTDVHLVVACTLRNRNTPAWPGCRSEAVKGLQLLESLRDEDASVLVTSSVSKVFQWKLTGQAEPVLLRTFSFGENIVTILSSRSTLAIFNDAEQVVLMELRSHDGYRAVKYQLATAVRASSVCFRRTSTCGSVLIDAHSQVELYQLVLDRPPAAVVSGSPVEATAALADADVVISAALPIADPAIVTTSIAGGPTSPPSLSAGSTRTTNPAICNLMQQIQRGNLRQTTASPPSTVEKPLPRAAPAAAHATAAVPPPTTVHPPSSVAARAVLHNPALPQQGDGILASATDECDENVRRELEGLTNVAKNISQILEITPGQITRDHAQLVDLALEAQMTELQNAGVSLTSSPTAGGRVTEGADRKTEDAFSSYVFAKLLAPLANEIAVGVTHGIDNTFRMELDTALRSAFGDSVRDAQKAALRRRLDEVLKESSTLYGRIVTDRMESFIKAELNERFAQVNACICSLVEENRRLQAAINDITRTDVVKEMEAMRGELQAIRDAAKAGELGCICVESDVGGANPSTFAGIRASADTILTTTLDLIKEGHPGRAMEYLELAKQPMLLGGLIARLSDDGYSELVCGGAVSEDTWARLLLQLFREDTVRFEPDAMEWEAELTLDVLSECEGLVLRNTMKTQQLLNDIRHFIAKAKRQPEIPVSVQRKLKDLEKSIQ